MPPSRAPAKDLNFGLPQIRHKNGLQVHEEVFSATKHQGKANQSPEELLLHSYRMTGIQRQEVTSVGKEAKREPCYTTGGIMGRNKHWRTAQRFLKKWKYNYIWASSLSSGWIPKEMKSPCHWAICIPTAAAALLTLAKIQKQPERLSVDKWIKKLWSWNNCSALKRKASLPFAKTWMNLENTVLSETGQGRENIARSHLCMESENKKKVGNKVRKHSSGYWWVRKREMGRCRQSIYISRYTRWRNLEV